MEGERTENVADCVDVTELVFFSDLTSNEAEAEALKTVKGLDGCLRCVHTLSELLLSCLTSTSPETTNK